jgi:uncharacterized membrane protein YgcG
MLLALLLAIAAPPKGQWATDETGKVSSQALDGFNRTAQELADCGAGQLGLAVVKTTNGEPPRKYATRVFNQWGIGHRGRNDGVLLFFALDDRKSEIVYGDGFPDGTSSFTDAIMRRDVVANMKAGRLDDAVTQGAASLARLARNTFSLEPAAPVEAEERIKEHSPRGWTIDLGYSLSREQLQAFDREGDAVYAAGKGMLFVALYDEAVPTARFATRLRQQVNRDDAWVVFGHLGGSTLIVDAPYPQRGNEDWDRPIRIIEGKARRQLGEARGDATAVVLEAMHDASELMLNGPPPKPVGQILEENLLGAGLGFGGFGIVGLITLRSWLRRRPRSCAGCGFPRHKLCEETDDPHLDAGQRLEEQLRSVDYDVWWCGRCNDALVLRYGAFLTSYSSCSGCGYKTMSSSSVTLVAATYDHGGTVEVTETCRNCPHLHTYKRHTARLTRSDDSSSSSSSWSSSSSSFGGGSSSGGGSSGSW